MVVEWHVTQKEIKKEPKKPIDCKKTCPLLLQVFTTNNGPPPNGRVLPRERALPRARPGYRVKEIGSTMSGRKGTDDSMTLQSQKFQIGDYLDIAITPPNRAPPSGRLCGKKR
ncbi:histone deacetylase complex subunit SAP18, partial [Sigmodon hispidus]